MFHTARTLIVAPNLTIYQEIEKNLTMTEKNFYQRTKFLSDHKMYPNVCSIGQRQMWENSDIIVANIQQLTNDKNFKK